MKPHLTPTEQYIIQKLMEGHINLKELAKQVGVSHWSIRRLLIIIYRKYQVDSLISLMMILRTELMEARLTGLMDPLMCDCGSRAIWRAPVIINQHADHLLLCDACRQKHDGSVEPALVILTNEQYGQMHDVLVNRDIKPPQRRRRKNEVRSKNTMPRLPVPG